MSDISQTELDRIAEEFSSAIRNGEIPSVNEYLEKYQDSSGQLRELLSSIAMIEGLKQDSGAAKTSHDQFSNIQQLGDYTIVREIGRGGMGIVFEALHQSLGRRCAVKVLAVDALGSTKSLARFRIEARAAAKLRHSNIVPVFGVGKAGEVNYYVMDYIDGISLKEWIYSGAQRLAPDAPTLDQKKSTTNNEAPSNTFCIEEVDLVAAATEGAEATGDDTSSTIELQANSNTRPTRNDAKYFHWVARAGATTSDALQYAHQQGVLHRDIKPANLLLDGRGEVWVADFGLAKLTENPSLTQTGDVIGTPQYMPPELFDGTYDARSEVYGVGLTLYELLAGRPAIVGKNASDTIRAAVAGAANSPKQFNDRIPRDLETIVRKCLAKAPADRYQTAGLLRDDLHRFASGHPISARPIGAIERVVRWARREPLIASFVLSTFVLLLALATVSAVAYVRTNNALNLAEDSQRESQLSLESKVQALAETNQQRRRAEGNLHVALDAFAQIMNNISSRSIETDADVLGEVTDTTAANVSPEDAKLLQNLLKFFDELAANNSQELLAESATAAHRAGDIYLSLGQINNAVSAYSDAITRYERLGEDAASQTDAFVQQADVFNELATISGIRGELLRAGDLFSDTVDLLEQISTPDNPEAVYQFARAHRIFASMGTNSGLESVEGGMRPSRPPKEGDDLPRGPRFPRRPNLERVIKGRAYVRTLVDRNAIEFAIESLDKLTEEFPDNNAYRAELSRAYRTKAVVAARSRSRLEAESAIRDSIQILEEMLASNPDSDAIRYELAQTLVSTEVPGPNQLMRAARAKELSGELLTNSPELPRYLALKAKSLESVASLMQKAGNPAMAERQLQEASRIYSDLLDASPELGLYETHRSKALESIAEIKLREGDEEAAVEYFERAIRNLQQRGRDQELSSVARILLQRLRPKARKIRADWESSSGGQQ